MATKGLVFECPVCQSPFRLTREMVGKRVACPHCDAAIQVPHSETGRAPKNHPLPASSDATSPTASKPAQETTSSDPPEPRCPTVPPPPPQSRPPAVEEPDAPTRESSACETVDPMGIPTFHAEPNEPLRPGDSNSPSPRDSNQRSNRATAPLAAVLPARFEVDDPKRFGRGSALTATTIMLPDAEGGTRTIDARRIHVLYRGEWVELTARTPEEAIRYRRMVNAIAILIGVGLVALAIAILLW